MHSDEEYNVKLDLFEGPLDLLLYLVAKSEVEIKNIAVAEIAKQYLEYLDILSSLNLNIASDYLSMAATLVRLKAQDLLPQDEKEEIDEGEEIVSKQQLIAKLLEYKKYKEAATSLRIYESEHIGSFPRGQNENIDNVSTSDSEESSLGTINMFDLISAFKKVIDRSAQIKAEDIKIISRETVKLDDRIEYVLGCLEDTHEVLFDDFFTDDNRKIVIVVTFMAILELVKMGQISFRQAKHFSSLFVIKRQLVTEKERDLI